MSTRIEWAGVADMQLVAPEAVEDAYGSTNEDYALVAFTGSDGVCLQGTLDEIIETLSGILAEAVVARESS